MSMVKMKLTTLNKRKESLMAKKKPVDKKTFLHPADKLELLEAINKSHQICQDSLECGAPRTDECHDAQNKLVQIARKLGYKQENWYSQFTL